MALLEIKLLNLAVVVPCAAIPLYTVTLRPDHAHALCYLLSYSEDKTCKNEKIMVSVWSCEIQKNVFKAQCHQVLAYISPGLTVI